MDQQHKLKWTVYVSLATLCFVVSVLEIGPLAYIRTRLFPTSLDPKYVIVFDGGSTGTRIHVFHFHNNTGQITLQNEYFEEVRPGLSSYAHNPPKAAASVLGLLDRVAKSRIPPSLWPESPVLLKATAGLRMLPTHLANDILDAVHLALSECPFLSTDESVAVLDGQDEGLYAWHTLNFLLGRLGAPGESVASLDLGGGSTQVTFLPRERETLLSSPHHHIVRRLNHSLYTHSYLGFGLMAAREQILDLSVDGTSPGRMRCVHPEAQFTWKYDNKEYKIEAHSGGEMSSMEGCLSASASFLASRDTPFFCPEELRRRDIYALSYYFDRAKDLGAIGSGGGALSVGSFLASCRRQCVRHDTTRPLLCLDCSYIGALLTHALRLPQHKTLHLVTEIKGFETSWALGAAFDVLKTL